MTSELLTVETVRPWIPPPSPQIMPAEQSEHRSGAVTTVLGFWVYLMSDCLLFAALFATYSVLGREFAGGPTSKELFDLPYVLAETLCLLASSFTYGMVMVALKAGDRGRVLGFLLLTFVLGLGFIGLEVKEFVRMIGEGAGPDRSAFLSCGRSEEHTSELQSRLHLVCRLLLEKKKKKRKVVYTAKKKKKKY